MKEYPKDYNHLIIVQARRGINNQSISQSFKIRNLINTIQKHTMKLLTLPLLVVCITAAASLTHNGDGDEIANANVHDHAGSSSSSSSSSSFSTRTIMNNNRSLRELTVQGEKCLNQTNSILLKHKDALLPLYELTQIIDEDQWPWPNESTAENSGEIDNDNNSPQKVVWKEPLLRPFCSFTEGQPPKCDVRRLPTDRIRFQEMKTVCESEEIGGIFMEFDARITQIIERNAIFRPPSNEDKDDDDNHDRKLEDIVEREWEYIAGREGPGSGMGSGNQDVAIKDIQNIPICLAREACTPEVLSVPLEEWVFRDFYTTPQTLVSTGCDERGTDEFFIKFKSPTKKDDGDSYGYDNENIIKAMTMTCSRLSNMMAKNIPFPPWMENKHPCDKKWSPLDQLRPARIVCPVTCRRSYCKKEDPGRVFLKKKPTLKNVGSVNQQTRTCAWLKEQNWAKRVLFCQRRFYREEGFPAIPSAYSACPKTCKWFVGRNANPKNRLGE